MGELRGQNAARFDFDAEECQGEEKAKKQQEEKRKGVTLREFGDAYFADKIRVPLVDHPRPKRDNSKQQELGKFKNLVRLLGDVPLSEIGQAEVTRFETEWVKVPLMRGPKKGKLGRNPGPELSLLRYLFNRAAETKVEDFDKDIKPAFPGQTLISAVPKITMLRLDHRNGSLEQEQYYAMREFMGREQQRYLIALWETGWRLNELQKLNWHRTNCKGQPLVDL